MKGYQRKAIKLAGEILYVLNNPVLCPVCSKPVEGVKDDRYGKVYHTACYNKSKKEARRGR